MESEILDGGILCETIATEDDCREYVGMGSDPKFFVGELDPAMFANDPDFQD